VTSPECFRCSTPNPDELQRFGDGYLCLACTPGTEDQEDHGESRRSTQERVCENVAEEGNPSPDTGDSFGGVNVPGDVRAAFADAIDFFHEQVDREVVDGRGRITTPRTYFEDERGWDPRTIGDARLGWAPADEDALREHLESQGYERDVILGTGLYGERDDGSLYAAWQGRYVFPYFDADSQPVFAISRSADHPADWKGNKYDKLQVSRDDVAVEEPIYGVETVDPGQPVLITEGVADAITAHEAGYPCLSPVTTTFKDSDRERLLDILDAHDVPRTYIINDAEPPSADITEDGRLTTTQFGPGVKGAVSTAEYLAEHGIDARIGELPQPASEKVDLDDYLQDWAGHDGLRPILASATPARQHPAHNPKDAAIDAAVGTREHATELTNDGIDADAPDTEHSALFDLEIREVTGLSWDYRGVSPLGHHGDSENYFVLLEKFGVEYDHKHKAAYNALTYLLCDAGERPANAPNGRLSDQEIFVAWCHAKDGGLIPDDDPIPHRALRHVAINDGYCECDDVENGWRLPADAYNGAVEAVRKQYDVDPGRQELRDRDDANPVAVLPNSPKVRASGWDWTHASRREDASLSRDDARKRTKDRIADAYDRCDQILVEALPTMGKSYGAIAAAAETGTPVTVLTVRGRKEQYEQIEQWCDEHGLNAEILPSFVDDERGCDSATGEFGKAEAERVRAIYERGATGQDIHKHADPACQAIEGQCTYTAEWSAIDSDEVDVLIGHWTHARLGRTVVFDEFDGNAFETTLDEQLAGAVTRFLQRTSGLPFDDYTDLVERRHDDQQRADALCWFDEHGIAPDGTLAMEMDGHATAPLAAFTILAGATENLGNGWERADLPDGGAGLFDREHERVHLLCPPDLSDARGVVALDGTPTVDMWKRALGIQFSSRRAVLSDNEREEYLRDVMNYRFIRTTDVVKSYSAGESEIKTRVTTREDAALLERIASEHDERPGLITTARAEEVYANAGVLDHVDDVDHYPVLGSNRHKHKRVGAVIGSRNYGPDYVKKWGAYLSETVQPTFPNPGNDFTPTDYGTLGNKIRTHMREHETLQAALRFGRDGGGAVVYVHTDTLPDWVPIAGEGRVLNTWSDGMRQVIDALDNLDVARTTDIHEYSAVDLSQRQVFNHLETLRDRGVVAREQNPTDGRGYQWIDDNLHELGKHGDVDLTPINLNDLTDAEVAEVGRTTYYRWDFRKIQRTSGTANSEHGTRAATDGAVGVHDLVWGAPPPG